MSLTTIKQASKQASTAIDMHNVFVMAKSSTAEFSAAEVSFATYSVAENNPTFAYTIIIFIERTSMFGAIHL